jgi:hypothetical protein
MIDILTSEDMENMSLHVFQYLTLYYIININIVWLYTMHENVSLNIDIKYFGKKTSIWWQLPALIDQRHVAPHRARKAVVISSDVKQVSGCNWTFSNKM